jgi:hypothetical protein
MAYFVFIGLRWFTDRGEVIVAIKNTAKQLPFDYAKMAHVEGQNQ